MRWAVGALSTLSCRLRLRRDTGALGERFDLRHLGDSVEIRIRDNGTGIPPEAKEKLLPVKGLGWACPSVTTSSSSNMADLLRSIRSPMSSPKSGLFFRAQRH
jgi:hypothetical protein